MKASELIKLLQDVNINGYDPDITIFADNKEYCIDNSKFGINYYLPLCPFEEDASLFYITCSRIKYES